MEITLPVYIAGSIANFCVWSCAYYYWKKCTGNEHRYDIVASYEPQDEQAQFMYQNEKEPLV